MAFELPTLPFPKDANGTPYIASPDASGKYTAAAGQWFKNASNIWTPVSAADPLPATDTELQNRLGALLAAAVTDPTASASVIATLKGILTDLGQTTDATVTAGAVGSLSAKIRRLSTDLDALLTKLGEVQASPTANTLLDRLKVVADRLGEISATPTANTALARLKALEGYLDGVEASLGATTDAAATGDGSLIAIVKQLRAMITDVWDSVNHRMKVDATLTGSIPPGDNLIGAIKVSDTNAAEFAYVGTAGDGGDPIGMVTIDLLSGFNGSSWDRWRNNTEGILLVSAARTMAVSSPLQTNHNSRGVLVILSVTAASGTGGLTLNIVGRDPVSSTDYNLNVNPTAVTAIGISVYALYPNASGTSIHVKQSTSLILPRTWSIYVSHADASSYTYSVGYSLIV